MRKQMKPCEYVAGLDLNFEWEMSEVNAAIKLLNNGASIYDLSKEFSRETLEVMILVNDLIIKNYVRQDKRILRRSS